jgi:hypothetical protein
MGRIGQGLARHRASNGGGWNPPLLPVSAKKQRASRFSSGLPSGGLQSRLGDLGIFGIDFNANVAPL